MMSDSKYSEEQCKEIAQFAGQFDERDDVQNKRFKNLARSLIPDLTHHAINNIYWKKGIVGLTKLETGKDMLHFSFNQSSASAAHKLAVSIKCTIIAVTQRHLNQQLLWTCLTMQVVCCILFVASIRTVSSVILHACSHETSKRKIWSFGLLVPASQAEGLERNEPYAKDSELTLKVKHNANLVLFLCANHALDKFLGRDAKV